MPRAVDLSRGSPLRVRTFGSTVTRPRWDSGVGHAERLDGILLVEGSIPSLTPVRQLSGRAIGRASNAPIGDLGRQPTGRQVPVSTFALLFVRASLAHCPDLRRTSRLARDPRTASAAARSLAVPERFRSGLRTHSVSPLPRQPVSRPGGR